MTDSVILPRLKRATAPTFTKILTGGFMKVPSGKPAIWPTKAMRVSPPASGLGASPASGKLAMCNLGLVFFPNPPDTTVDTLKKAGNYAWAIGTGLFLGALGEIAGELYKDEIPATLFDGGSSRPVEEWLTMSTSHPCHFMIPWLEFTGLSSAKGNAIEVTREAIDGKKEIVKVQSIEFKTAQKWFEHRVTADISAAVELLIYDTLQQTAVPVTSRLQQEYGEKIPQPIINLAAKAVHQELSHRWDGLQESVRQDWVRKVLAPLIPHYRKIADVIGKRDWLLQTGSAGTPMEIWSVTDLNPAELPDLATLMPHNERGVALFDEGDLDRAIMSFDEAIRHNPGNPVPLVNRANALRQKGMKEKAEADVSEAIRLNPKMDAACFLRGEIRRERGEIDLAIADFAEAIRLNPKHAEAHHSLGLVYFWKGDFENALAQYSQSVKLNPGTALVYLNRALVYMEKGAFDQAISDLNQTLKIEPKGLIPLIYRARAYLANGEFDHSINDCTKLIEADPNYIVAYGMRGEAHLSKKEYVPALIDLNQSLRLDPQRATYSDLNGVDFKRRGFIANVASYTKLLDANKNDSETYLKRGYLYFELVRLEDAISDFTRSLKENVRPANVLMFRGYAYFLKNDFDLALQDFNQCIPLDPSNAMLRRLRSLVYESKGDQSLAKADMDEVVRLEQAQKGDVQK